jgi:hypothetical protein
MLCRKLCDMELHWHWCVKVSMYIERVHAASASTIHSCDSPKLGTCVWVRTAKKTYV